MVAVDTSVWIAALRDPFAPTGERLRHLLDDDEVLLPVPVRVELLAGTAARDQARMKSNLAALPLLVPSDGTWFRLEAWVCEAATAGEHYGIVDLLIAAQAAESRVAVWSLDRAFDRMAARGWIRVHRVLNSES